MLFIAMVLPAFTQQSGNNPGQPKFVCGDSLKDSRDGKIYGTVQIGSQCWLKENLNTGTRIRGDHKQANNNIIEKFCYGNLEENCNVYGGLYQWNEAMQYTGTPKAKGICPAGWHVPADEEWDTLVAFLGGDVSAGKRMKEPGDTHFKLPNFGATNQSGFTALPGGYSYATGSYYFDKIQVIGYFWSSTPENETDVWIRTLFNAREGIGRYLNYKSTGISVRCVAD